MRERNYAAIHRDADEAVERAVQPKRGGHLHDGRGDRQPAGCGVQVQRDQPEGNRPSRGAEPGRFGHQNLKTEGTTTSIHVLNRIIDIFTDVFQSRMEWSQGPNYYYRPRARSSI